MTCRRLPWFGVALMLGAALAFMWKPMCKETATVDETVFLGAGYSYWQGHRYYLNPEHPPLMQLWSALPLLYLNVKPPGDAAMFFNGTSSSSGAVTWASLDEHQEKLAPASEQFYHYPAAEAVLFGSALVYGGYNDADTLLFWGRFMQALVTLGVGLLVFLWARSLGDSTSGLLALAVWCFNPVALAYGHLILTDAGISLTLPLAVWMFARFLESPRPRAAWVAGLAFGGALLTKYTAVILIPIFGLLVATAWCRASQSICKTSARGLLGTLCLFGAAAWGTVLLLYLPHWMPPPPLTVEEARQLQVPAWFAHCRWLLIPRDFFKGFTIMLLHVRNGHDAYLMGRWLHEGCWYFYPVVILLKTPVALLLLVIGAVTMAARRFRNLSFAETAPLIAAVVYLSCAMTSKANIGIRHLLPVYPLLAVMIGIEFAHASRTIRLAGWLTAVWLMVTAFIAYTCHHADYIASFNEFIGDPGYGQDYLVDSNFDWGQDGKRLKAWVAENHVALIYLDYFGTDAAIEYLHIPNVRVKPAQAREIHNGYLVISATRLMRPEYAWLRDVQKPIGRIGYTLFVYSF
jgi:hypothetical protein